MNQYALTNRQKMKTKFHSDEFNAFCRGMRNGLLISTLLWCLIIGCAVWFLESHDPPTAETPTKHNGFATEQKLEKMRMLHKYHGTNHAWYEGGKWWFNRDGKVCELWNPNER